MTDEIISRVFGHLGHITLNRPAALNALTQDMCEELTRLLLKWEADENISAVLVDGAGERAFCAGGDVILLHESGRSGDDRAENFWRTEYKLNELIYRYKKPYVTLIDGFVMGGGVGLSVHGKHRLAGDNTLFAMPETGIGYFPDVGGTYFLPRLGMDIGQWLGLTGARLTSGQACVLGVATDYIPTEQHAELITALAKVKPNSADDAVSNVLGSFVKTPPDNDTIPDAVKAFKASSVPEILLELDGDGGEWAAKQASILRRKSPLACCVTFEALRRGADLSFRQAMTQELNLSLNFLKTMDFYEGIRAQLIDKDRNPNWTHADADAVTLSDIEQLFQTTAIPPQQFF